MKKATLALLVVPLLLIAALGARPAYAHNEVDVAGFKIVAGWGVEPPLQGQLNSIEITITDKDGKPVSNAFASEDVTIKKGGLTKALDMKPTEKAGVYSGDIIPSEIGQFAVVLSGKIGDQDVSAQIIVEDVEDIGGITFPQSGTGSQGLPKDFVNQIQGVITDLTAQVDSAKSSAQTASGSAQNATALANEIKGSADRAFLVGIVGVGVGVAGIAVAAIALSRRT